MNYSKTRLFELMRGPAYLRPLEDRNHSIGKFVLHSIPLQHVQYIHGFVLFQVDVPSQCKVVSVSCGSDFTFILTTTGRLLGFGNNDENQLGIDTPQSLRKRQVKVCLRLILFVYRDRFLFFVLVFFFQFNFV